MTQTIESSGLSFAACNPVAAKRPYPQAGYGGRAAETNDPQVSAAPNNRAGGMR